MMPPLLLVLHPYHLLFCKLMGGTEYSSCANRMVVSFVCWINSSTFQCCRLFCSLSGLFLPSVLRAMQPLLAWQRNKTVQSRVCMPVSRQSASLSVRPSSICKSARPSFCLPVCLPCITLSLNMLASNTAR